MTCPYCQNLAGDLVWDREARILRGRGATVRFSRTQAKVFDALWGRRDKGVSLSCREMMALVYADDPSGGPESENIITVVIAQHIRPKIKAFNLAVERGRLIDLGERKDEAA
jgi:hypothetical protein